MVAWSHTVSGYELAPNAGPSAGVPPKGPASTVKVKFETPSSSAMAPIPAGIPIPKFTIAPRSVLNATNSSRARRCTTFRTSSGKVTGIGDAVGVGVPETDLTTPEFVASASAGVASTVSVLVAAAAAAAAEGGVVCVRGGRLAGSERYGAMKSAPKLIMWSSGSSAITSASTKIPGTCFFFKRRNRLQ